MRIYGEVAGGEMIPVGIEKRMLYWPVKVRNEALPITEKDWEKAGAFRQLCLALRGLYSDKFVAVLQIFVDSTRKKLYLWPGRDGLPLSIRYNHGSKECRIFTTQGRDVFEYATLPDVANPHNWDSTRWEDFLRGSIEVQIMSLLRELREQSNHVMNAAGDMRVVVPVQKSET